MSRITNILDNARDTLADANKSRWTDTTLIRHLNMGIRYAILKAKALKTKSYIKIEPLVAKYDLSAYAMEINRVQYLNVNVTAKTDYELDRLNSNWEDEVGTEVKHVTFSNLPSGVFKIYPKIEEGTVNIYAQNQVYGGLIDITYTDDLFEFPVDELTVEAEKYLVVHYIRKPSEVTIATTDNDLEFDSLLDDALSMYVSGMALRNDADTLNRQFGAEQINLFDNFITTVFIKNTMNNNTVAYKEIPYRGFQ